MGKLKKFLRKKQRKNKASKSRKKRQRNNRKKATADPKKWDGFNNTENVCKQPSPKPVSEDYLYALSRETMDALGVTYINSHHIHTYTGPHVLNSAADPKNWDAFMKSKKDYSLLPPKPVPEDYLDTLKRETMDALGVTYINSHHIHTYTGPHVLNSAADPKGWMPFNNSWIDPL